MVRIFSRHVLSIPLSLYLVDLVSPLQAWAAPAASEVSHPPGRFQSLGPWSISAGFPNGGSIWGTPALGLRTELMDGEFVSLGLQLSANRATKAESFAVLGKWQHMALTPTGRSFPYFFLQLGMQSSKDSESAKSQSSLLSAFGIGVEISLLREISTSIETGFGGVFWPSSQVNYNAATTQLSVHYHFQY